MQTELLQLSKWDKVLEIGTGCAYQTAVLSELGYRVFSIERQRSLYQLAQKSYQTWIITLQTFFFGDGFAGLPKFAPFKGILVTCGAPKFYNAAGAA